MMKSLIINRKEFSCLTKSPLAAAAAGIFCLS
jgi:hypothetical protein